MRTAPADRYSPYQGSQALQKFPVEVNLHEHPSTAGGAIGGLLPSPDVTPSAELAATQMSQLHYRSQDNNVPAQKSGPRTRRGPP